ncbi:MAG: hypothetical protein MRY83_08450 [Flavobacteriales bacterium]|nr:hypothetical protein [Flavobacteriales bacterium]
MFYFELAVIALIVILQFIAFFTTRKRLRQLHDFFPTDLNAFSIVNYNIPKRILKDKQEFQLFISGIEKNADDSVWEDEATEKVEVLALDETVKNKHKQFSEVVASTNAYLCKNKGAAADFNILQDICERYIQRLDNSIGNLINVPLYIGLAGTFVGIIVGLWGIEFTDASGSINSASIDELLKGVIAAMFASLLGLVLTVINTALTYKTSVYKNDTDKNQYYDFVQRELLPVLSIGMAGSLSSFRGVLNNFISKFGENISEYHDTAALLNDNLSKQHLVLEEINKLSLTRTSSIIAETFSDLKNSSEQLKMFISYQQGLNQNIVDAQQVVSGLNTTLDKYQNFNTNLEAISQNVNSSIELQRQLKDSLELHFPTINDHKEIWRNQVDEINSDIKNVYKELAEYFKTSTHSIQEFITKNNNFFAGQNDTQNAIKIIVETAKIQNEQFKSLNDQMVEVRKDLRSSQQASLDLNKDLVEAVKGMTLKLSKLEVISTNGKG